MKFRHGEIHVGDCLDVLRTIPKASCHCCVTSPPYYGLRDYGHVSQIGLEKTPAEYVAKMVEVMRGVRRVLRDDGTLWLNVGDSYNNAGSSRNGEGLDGNRRGGATGPDGECGYKKRDNRHAWRDIGIKHKDLIGVPWMLAFALRDDGWYLRQDIIWHKPNPMPGSVRDRCTTSHEYLFLLTKKARYYYDPVAIHERVKDASVARAASKFRKTERDGRVADVSVGANDRTRNGLREMEDMPEHRNKRSVWTVSTKSFKGAHFAVMPEALARTCVLAGTSVAGCCSSCGAPLVRQVERERVATRPGTDSKVHGTSAETHGNRDPERHVARVRTVGWEPSCGCAAAAVPCTVLDPFSGAGTTAAVAVKLARRFVGIELNEEYAEMSYDRVARATSRRGFGLA